MNIPLRYLLPALGSCLSLLPAQAQSPTPPVNCAHPFGLYDNNELVYQLQDAAGKATGLIRTRVVRLGEEVNKKQTLTTTTVVLKSGIYDKKNHLVRTQDLTYRCRRDTSFTDGMGEVDHSNLRSFRDRRVVFAPVPLAWPNQPAVGSELPGGGVAAQVSSSAVDIARVYTTVRNRRVVSGPSPVETPAGTFACYQVESERESATAARADLVIRNVNRVVDYYSPTEGIVKTEIYGKNGKLEQTRLLTERHTGGKMKVKVKEKTK